MAETDTLPMAEEGEEMPPTGSPLPLIGAVAAILIGVGVALRFLPKPS
jgi:hypothetical protein